MPFYCAYVTKTLILSDLSAHHSNWSYKTDRTELEVFDGMLEHNYSYFNNNQLTRLRLANGLLQKTSTDISFVIYDLATLFRWQVCKECLSSDHVVIKLSVTLNISRTTLKKEILK